MISFKWRDSVVTEGNGLIYMRARYYNVDYRRFANADVIAGNISKAVTLNRYAYANGNPVSLVDPFGLSAERGNTNDYYMYSGISPWGPPNSHVTVYEGYWKERWYGSDGRAIKDKHWTDHSSAKKHPNPHYQDWDWSNPEHPDLKEPYPPSNNDPKDPPSSSGQEPWNDDTSSSSSNDEENDSYNNKSSMGSAILGTGIIIVGVLAIAWVVGNDVTGIGTADDVALAPLTTFLGYGMNLVLGH